jgi:ZIP family zinc transporter
MMEVQNRVMSFVKDTKDNCDADGPCYGYSDPCGRECFNRIGSHSIYGSRKSFPRGLSASRVPTGVLEVTEEQAIPDERASTVAIISSHASHAESYDHEHSEEACGSEGDAASDASEEDSDIEAQHHHHVPTNAFLSIGLQTSIAIALHKLPEGFITYATNHASPSLGFTVFMALFIHNITEGFAMALPLYLALGSRLKAMLWSSLLGGFSQPLGAGIAAIWFKVATHTSGTPGAAVYGCMFAVTAGIMTSVALALFVEGLSVNHNAPLCVGSALVGMGILGVSTALTAEGGGHH